MGHDIEAYRPGINQDELREKHRLDDYGKGWSKRYESYCSEARIASNRRSAGNPLNQVLYLALGVFDEAYAGCSGNGIEMDITREQFENAAHILELKNFDGMTRERNFSDDIFEMFAAAGAEVIDGSHGDSDVSQEREFVTKCIEHLKQSGEPSLRVYFG